MKKKKLIGNSGCKLEIIFNKSFFVKKISTNKKTSTRLEAQYKKITSFCSIRNIKAPKIVTFYKKKYFNYTMEYINGEILIDYINTKSTSEVKKIFKDIFFFINDCKKKSSEFCDSKTIFNKIKNLEIFTKSIDQVILKKIFTRLYSHNWSHIEKSFCHGDLTLENILINNQNIFFIDLSENFISSYKLDISKLLFDLITGWSNRNLNHIGDIQIYSLKKNIIKYILHEYSNKDLEDIKCLILIDSLRVLSYLKNDKHAKLILKTLNNFYGNINNPLRW